MISRARRVRLSVRSFVRSIVRPSTRAMLPGDARATTSAQQGDAIDVGFHVAKLLLHIRVSAHG